MTTEALQASTSAPVAIRTTIVALVLAMLAALTASWLLPTALYADRYPMPSLEQTIPDRFGDWRWDRVSVETIASAQAATLVKQIYSQVISRVYVDSKGQRVMLSIAYGPDQREGLQVHRPEFCYAAQGFALGEDLRARIPVAHGEIPVTRFVANRAGGYTEPVTYWRTIGRSVIVTGTDKRLNELRYALEGLVADGIVFRVSSIGGDIDRAYSVQANFVAALVGSLNEDSASRIAGIGSK